MVNDGLPGAARSRVGLAREFEPRRPAMPLTVKALDHLVLNVSDVEASAAWYARVLGMTREDFSPAEGKPPRTEMKFGRQKINLRPLAATREDWFTADHEAAGSDDLCFLTDSTPDEVVRHLEAEGVAIVAGPGPRRGARGTLTSVYCRDPDGSLIEIASYPDN
jgi:catechol 2,3-dioxygenase-like lactoylglutathione lyase family enzyme